MLDLKLHTEVSDDRAWSSFGPLTNLPFLNQNLLYVGATGNHSGNSSCSNTRAINHVAGFKQAAISYKVVYTNICYLAAVWQKYFF